MVSSLKERAPSLGLISTQPQGIQQNASTGKIEHATTLTYCHVITYTKSSIVLIQFCSYGARAFNPYQLQEYCISKPFWTQPFRRFQNHLLLQSALLKQFLFPVAVGLLLDQSTNSGILYTKNHFSVTLCELLTRCLSSGQRLHI